jgi:hypothetical protein
MNILRCSRGWRTAKLMSLAILPTIALAASDNATLQVGKANNSGAGGAWVCVSGYNSSISLGSYSPTGLTGGKTVTSLYDVDAGILGCTSHVGATLNVSGFSSDPGQAWVTSATCNAVAKTGASASFSYSGGTATWNWGSGSSFNLISKASGTNVSCTIVHS